MSRIEQQLNDYIQYMTEELNLSPHTRDAYERDLRSFISHLLEQKVEEAKLITELQVRQYFNVLRASGRAASTLTRHKAALRSFFHYLIREGSIHTDPTLQLELPRAERKQPELLSVEQVNQLLDAPDCRSLQGMRDQAMLETLYGTGMRITELIALNVEDLHLQLGFVRCVMNQQERIIPLGQMAVEAIQKYMMYARSEWVNQPEEDIAGGPLFVNMRGQRLTRQGFWKMLKRYTSELGWEDMITPFTLRQSFAAHLLNNGADLHAVQEILGHADAATTQRYAGVLQKRPTMKDVYTMSHPRARMKNED